MKMRLIAYSLLFAMSALIFTSCKKGSEQGKLIPNDAAIVLILNGASMNEKLPIAEVKNGTLFQDLYNDSSTDATMKAIMDDPSNTGIAVDKEIIMFVVKDTAGGYAAIEGSVKDADKMKAFFNNTVKDASNSDKDNVHYTVKDNITASWNKERFVIIMDMPEMKKIATDYFEQQDSASSVVTYRDGSLIAASIYNLQEKNSLAKNETFSELMEQKGDIHFWFSGEKIQGDMMKSMGPLSMMNLSKLIDGSIASGVINFEDGKMVMDIASYSNKELFSLWKKYKGSNINTDMIERSPIKEVAGIFSMNYKPELIKELLKLTGMEGFANVGASMVGFSTDDFVKAVGNDVLFCLGDLTIDSSGVLQPKGFFATSIADKVAFGKIIAAGKKMGQGAPVDGKLFYNANDNYFAIGTDKSLVDDFVGGKQKNRLPFLDKISGKPVGGYMNFQYILASMKPAVKDSAAQALHAASVAMWDNVYITGGDADNGAIRQHVEVNLIDKKMNSLKALNNYLNTMGMIAKKNEDKFKEEFKMLDSEVDSTMTKKAPMSQL